MMGRTTRFHDVDAAHGLLVLYMMFMHLLGFAIGTVSKYYYPLTHFLSFFMAWFYFKAGMFYCERTIIEGVKKATHRLLIPAIIYSLLGFFLYAVLRGFQIDLCQELLSFYQFGALQGNNPIWFLYSLFLVQTIYNALRRLKTKVWLLPLLSVVLFAITSFTNVDSMLFINVPLGLFFYSMGVVLSEKQYKSYIWIPALLGFIILGAIPSVNDFRRGYYDPFLVGFLWSLCSCLAINGLFRQFPILCLRPLRFVGQNAMAYFGTHWMVILIIQAICAAFSLERSISIVVYFGVFCCYLLICSLILFWLNKTLLHDDE